MALQDRRLSQKVHFNVYPDQKRLLVEAAKKSQMSLSDLLRTWLREFLDEYSKDEHSSNPDESGHSSPGGLGKVLEGPRPFTERLNRVFKG